MKCCNCKMLITGIVCKDISENSICFECWYSSKLSTDGTIACPKCWGIGQLTMYYQPKLKKCKVCEGKGRIQKAETETYVIKSEPALVECPF